MIRIAHLSTAHGRHELRVHLKECNSLAASGYEVHYIVADGLGDERIGEVEVHDIGRARGRLERLLFSPWRMLVTARQLNTRLYHFHDPEILLVALFLGRREAKVVYDSHEDVPRSLLSRNWMPRWIRPGLSAVFEAFENFVARRLSAIVGATPHIAARFAGVNPITEAINNYPLRHELEGEAERRGPSRNVCYLGGIGRIRGIEEMVHSVDKADARLILAGRFESSATEQNISALPGWGSVDYRGTVSRSAVRQIMAESQAGLVIYHPEPNHIDAQPNKLFEYMAAGLPVIASDFPLWREIVDGAGCGLLVDPLDPEAIADAMQWLLDHPDQAEAMGQGGRAAVESTYNWQPESEKLLGLYRRILGEETDAENKETRFDDR